MKSFRCLAVAGSLCLLLVAATSCCRSGNPKVDRVVAWAQKNGMRIDGWQAGQLPSAGFSEDAWIAEGRALPEAERILLDLLAEPPGRLEPVLAVRALGAVGTSASIPALEQMTKHSWDVMRSEAVYSLGQIGDPAALGSLAMRLLYDEARSVRVTAAMALANLGDARGLEVMEEAVYMLNRELGAIEKERARLQEKLGQKRQSGSKQGSAMGSYLRENS